VKREERGKNKNHDPTSCQLSGRRCGKPVSVTLPSPLHYSVIKRRNRQVEEFSTCDKIIPNKKGHVIPVKYELNLFFLIIFSESVFTLWNNPDHRDSCFARFHGVNQYELVRPLANQRLSAFNSLFLALRGYLSW